MAIESETREAKRRRKWEETRASSSEENITKGMTDDVMDKEVDEHNKVLAPGSKRKGQKAEEGRKEKHADVRIKKNLAKAVVSELTVRATNKPDEIDRMVASGIEGEGNKKKKKRAKSVVSKVEDTAINERCVSKVIDSLAKIGKSELIELGRFNVPAFLSMTAPHR